jgi:hypothetical protein
MNTQSITAAEARAIAEEAYVFGYAMVENYKSIFGFCLYPKSPVYSGFNKYQHNRKLYDPDFTLVVTPNNDTLYSTTFADLRTEPLVISVPPTGDRYFVIQLVDGSSDNLAYIGTRETGRNGGEFVLVGPNYKGYLATDRFDRVIVSPSQFVALVTRTGINGAEDTAGATAIQDNLHLTPLSQFLGQPAPEPAPAVDFLPFDPAKVDGIEFFTYLDMVLNWHTPRLDEVGILGRMKRIGVLAGGLDEFDAGQFSPEVQAALLEGIHAGRKAIEERGSNLGERINGWEYTPPMGHFGTDYLFRSAVAWKFMYTNSQEEALYPIANVDGNGSALDGKSNYLLRFEKDGTPPVDGFWSVTMYDGKTQLLVRNDLKRYSIGDRTPGLKFDPDGGLTLHLQHSSPGTEPESNWLPAPDGSFYLVLRAYVPKEEIISGRYRLPPVQLAQ